MFTLKGDNIVNEKGKVLDVAGGLDNEGQNIIVYSSNNKINQRWTIVYVDEDKPEPKKGQYNQDFGLYVERPFYIESNLGSKRFLDLIGNNVVIKSRTGYATQQFYFDQTSKTIKSVAQNRKSFDIASSGRSTNL
jgi:hypothetical protein